MDDPLRHQPTRIINPLGPRVLVRLIPPDNRTTGGLYVPENLAHKDAAALYGEVIEVARASSDDPDQVAGANVSGIPEGARILFAPDKGLRIPWNDDLRLVETRYVLAVVEEVTPEEAH